MAEVIEAHVLEAIAAREAPLGFEVFEDGDFWVFALLGEPVDSTVPEGMDEESAYTACWKAALEATPPADAVCPGCGVRLSELAGPRPTALQLRGVWGCGACYEAGEWDPLEAEARPAVELNGHDPETIQRALTRPLEAAATRLLRALVDGGEWTDLPEALEALADVLEDKLVEEPELRSRLADAAYQTSEVQ